MGVDVRNPPDLCPAGRFRTSQLRQHVDLRAGVSLGTTRPKRPLTCRKQVSMSLDVCCLSQKLRPQLLPPFEDCFAVADCRAMACCRADAMLRAGPCGM